MSEHSCTSLKLQEACGLAFDAGRREAGAWKHAHQLLAEVDRLKAKRLRLLDTISERGAALMAAKNIEGGKAVLSLVRELADG